MEINETRIRYLEAIQRVVDRLSNISFILKGWAVSLVAGLMALAASGSNQGFVLIAYIPIAVFWFLDAYFLMMERQYRDLFKENIDLSQKLKQFTLKREKGNIVLFAKALFSITMLTPLLLPKVFCSKPKSASPVMPPANTAHLPGRSSAPTVVLITSESPITEARDGTAAPSKPRVRPPVRHGRSRKRNCTVSQPRCSASQNSMPILFTVK